MDKYLTFFKELCARKNIKDFQLLITKHNSIRIQGKNKEINLNVELDMHRISLRLLKNKKISQVSATFISKDILKHMLERARKLMQNTIIKEFPVYKEYPSVRTFDRKLSSLMNKPDYLSSTFQDILQKMYALDKKKLIKNLDSSFSIIETETWFLSSKMKEPVYNRNTFYSSFFSINSNDHDFIGGGKWDEEKFMQYGPNFLKTYTDKEFGKEESKISGLTPVILHPAVISNLFLQLISEHLYASSFVNKITRLVQGEKYFSDKINVIDDGTQPYMAGTLPIDDEGVISKKNSLFKKGIFVDYLYDLVHSIKLNHEPTGNGIHRPTLIESYEESPIRCGIRNILMEPGNTPVEKLIKDINNGLYIKSLLGVHTADKVRGAFSTPIAVGYLIKNGKIAGRLQQGTWAIRGKIDELLQNPELSKEQLYLGKTKFPWIKTDIEVM